MPSQKLKQLALHALEELKAEKIVSLDVAELTSITDTMIICNGRSSRHIHSIADNLVETAKHAGLQPLSIDGKNSNDWVLVDLGDVVVHVMMPQTREFYALEKLWDNKNT